MRAYRVISDALGGRYHKGSTVTTTPGGLRAIADTAGVSVTAAFCPVGIGEHWTERETRLAAEQRERSLWALIKERLS